MSVSGSIAVGSRRCFVIAEAGVNHNGSASLAHRLIDAAADSGADAVKFQTFDPEQLARPATPAADYQRDSAPSGDQLEMLRSLELSREAYPGLVRHCRERGLEFLSTPFDVGSAEFLVSLGMARIKVASGELTNLPFLSVLATMRLPLIVSTGMATLAEVEIAVDRVVASGGSDITLLHCTSSYPAPYEDVNLLAMVTLRERFGLPVGYSDHTLGTTVAVGAAALGAAVIEKHFTLDKDLPGPDHRMSLEVPDLARMVQEIRVIESSLGTGVKSPSAGELAVRDVVRRSITAKNPICRGSVICADDLILLRPGTGIPPEALDEVIGRRATRDLDRWTTLSWSDIA